jgi:hypothetical protein
MPTIRNKLSRSGLTLRIGIAVGVSWLTLALSAPPTMPTSQPASHSQATAQNSVARPTPAKTGAAT